MKLNVTLEEQWLDCCRQMFICVRGARERSEGNIEAVGMGECPEKPKNFKCYNSQGLDGIEDELFRRVSLNVMNGY
jgi:hypothetical protein